MKQEAAAAESAPPPVAERRQTGAAAERHAGEVALGRQAEKPAQIPWAGWKRVLRRTGSELITDRISLTAAGCAFYAMLALFPSISMLVSVYGLVFNRASVEGQLQVLRNLLPQAGYTLISDRVHALVTQPPGTLTLSLVVSFLITFYSATTGTKSILGALNLAYEEREKRSFIRYQITALAMTLAGIVSAVIGIAFLVVLPVALAAIGVPGSQKLLLNGASFVVLLLFVVFALSLLYRFGPSREAPRWQWVTPGSLVATVLWVVASAAFSYYVGHFASYDVTYGPLGAVIGVMMWFWVTAFVVLLGAELNAELELQTLKDSTDGAARPIGQRGAFVADHIASD